MSYCKYVKDLAEDNLHKIYHDKHYGVMLSDDDEIFGRLILEINQAGLSWDTILKKEKNFRKAYSDFSIKKIAKYDESDIEKLMSNAGIIRNRLKINAAIHNANIILNLKVSQDSGSSPPPLWGGARGEACSFKDWLVYNSNHSLYNNKLSAAKYFKKSGFKFVGGEIVGEFLMSLGLLQGGHDMNCEYYKRSHFAKATRDTEKNVNIVCV